MNFNKEKIISVLSWTVTGILLFFVFADAIMGIVGRSDYRRHLITVSKAPWEGLIRNPIGDNCYPIWHILTWLAMNLLGCSARMAAVVVTGGCIVGTWACVAWCFSKRHGEGGREIARVASVCLMLVMAIWLPFFNQSIFLGQGGPNVVHNPTNVMVRLIAFPCFICYAALMDGIGKTSCSCLGAYKIVGMSLLVFLATLAKPCFVQMFFPALFVLSVFKLIRYRSAAICPVAAMAVSFVPVVSLIVLQSWAAFCHGDGSGMGVAFLAVWNRYSPNFFVSMLLAILFPLIVLIWGIRARKLSTEMVLAWIMYAVALAESAILIEPGRRMWHGNFCWAYNLALFFIWFTAIDGFISLAKECFKKPVVGQRLWFWSAVCVLSLHVVSGLCYLWRVILLGMWT